jgi:hypothetical protein
MLALPQFRRFRAVSDSQFFRSHGNQLARPSATFAMTWPGDAFVRCACIAAAQAAPIEKLASTAGASLRRVFTSSVSPVVSANKH